MVILFWQMALPYEDSLLYMIHFPTPVIIILYICAVDPTKHTYRIVVLFVFVANMYLLVDWRGTFSHIFGIVLLALVCPRASKIIIWEIGEIIWYLNTTRYSTLESCAYLFEVLNIPLTKKCPAMNMLWEILQMSAFFYGMPCCLKYHKVSYLATILCQKSRNLLCFY